MSQSHPGSPPSVDHVWANARVFLPSGRASSACQLGGDRLGPHLAELADLAVVVGPAVRGGTGWTAVRAPVDRAPFAPGGFALVAVEDLGTVGGPPGAVLEAARRLCRPGGTVLVGLKLGPRRPRLPAALRGALRDWPRDARPDGRDGSRGEVLVALPSQRRPAFLLRATDRDPVRYFVRRVAFAYRQPNGSGVRVRLQQARSRVALAAPPPLAVRGAPGRLVVLPSPTAVTPPVSAVPRSLLDGVCALVRDSWSALGLDGSRPERLAPLVVGHRRPTTGMVTVLLFRTGDRSPSVVAKLPRYGPTGEPLRREAAALERVRGAIAVGTLAGAVRDAIPRPLGLHKVDGTEVLLQTGMPGMHLVAATASGRAHPAKLARRLELLLGWCLELQAASARRVTVDDALLADRLEPLAAEGLAAMDADPRVATLLDRSLEAAAGLRGTALPLVVCHGDYWAGNVVVAEGSVRGVIDWERATLDDLPLWDLVKAVGSAAYHLDRYRSLPRRGPGALPGWGDLGPWAGIGDPVFAASFRAAFVQQGWLAGVTRDALVRAFGRGGIPLGWLPVALTFYLVRQVVQASDSPRSVAGWGSVLRALAAAPGTWADELAQAPEAPGTSPRATTGARHGRG
jgi:aminoglycoside phosphotransferase/SAM-dependent methyltransferase